MKKNEAGISVSNNPASQSGFNPKLIETMNKRIEGLSSCKQQEWEDDLKKLGNNVESQEVMSLELERHLPSYLFLVLDPDPPVGWGGFQPKGKVAFYTQDDRPFALDEDNKLHWYIIPPDNLMYVKLKIRELFPSVEVREGMEGYVIPLQESRFFNKKSDVVSYQRNLMFWESMLFDDDYGPFASRFAFLAHHIYQKKEIPKQQSKERWFEIYNVLFQKKDDVEKLLALFEYDMMEEKHQQARLRQQFNLLQQIFAENEKRNRERTEIYRVLLEKVNHELYSMNRHNDDEK